MSIYLDNAKSVLQVHTVVMFKSKDWIIYSKNSSLIGVKQTNKIIVNYVLVGY